MTDKITEWNLKAKAERDAINFSKVRELRRDNKGVTLHGERVEVIPCCKPEFISSSGYATRYFNGEADIKRGVYVNIEKRCSELGADCYEVGENLITWSRDPGFGSRTENYVVQFYKIDYRLEKIKEELTLANGRAHTMWWEQRMREDNEYGRRS